jgi:S-formylglutathione hydrolase FrmB
MKKLTLIAALILTANLLFAQINKIDTSFYSEALQETKMVDIYFPPGYDENPDLYYPVIYYLHGWTGNQNSMGGMLTWAQSLINNGTIDPVIMVGADNSPEPFEGSAYVNSIIWGNYEDYMINDLINWVETSFRAMPDRNYRGMIGNSMGGYGAFRYGILHKDIFKAFAAHGTSALSFDVMLETWIPQIILENQPGPPFSYNYATDGSFTKAFFLFGGAASPNLNTPQTYINPPIVEYLLDENAMVIDTIYNKWQAFDLSQLIHQLSSEDSVGILFACGTNDDFLLYPSHLAFRDTLDLLGLPYEFYSHNGGHTMPGAFKKRAFTFLDSLLMSPGLYTQIELKSLNNKEIRISNFPNPFTNSTTIQFKLREPGYIELEIWNYCGQLVGKLLEGNISAGKHKILFDVSKLPSGIYFCHLQIGNETVTKKIIKVK